MKPKPKVKAVKWESDLKPFVHGEEGTHGACDARFLELGDKTTCCACTGHNCEQVCKDCSFEARNGHGLTCIQYKPVDIESFMSKECSCHCHVPPALLQQHAAECVCPTTCVHCQPQPTTDEWAEFDKEFPYYPNEPIYSEENQRNRARMKQWIAAHFISKQSLVAEGERRKEVCLCAAIETKEGKIVRGHRHSDCLWAIQQAHLTAREQGFLTSFGRFVTREEGRKLQDAAGIPSKSFYRGDSLYSEDLY